MEYLINTGNYIDNYPNLLFTWSSILIYSLMTCAKFTTFAYSTISLGSKFPFYGFFNRYDLICSVASAEFVCGQFTALLAKSNKITVVEFQAVQDSFLIHILAGGHSMTVWTRIKRFYQTTCADFGF